MTIQETKEYHLKKLYGLSLRCFQKNPELNEPNDKEQEWLDTRMTGTPSTWERWDGMIEEWTPFNRFGDWVNHLRRYYKNE